MTSGFLSLSKPPPRPCADGLARRANSGRLRRREPAAEPELLRVGASEVDVRAHAVRTWDGRDAQLSDSEVRLLRLLAGRAGAVVGRREIVQHLFGPQTRLVVGEPAPGGPGGRGNLEN